MPSSNLVERVLSCLEACESLGHYLPMFAPWLTEWCGVVIGKMQRWFDWLKAKGSNDE